MFGMRHARRRARFFGASRARALARDESGVSALEFALLAPLFILSTLVAIDLGMAANDRMTLDNIVRAAAQKAMADPGPESVLAMLEAVAGEELVSADNPLALSADRVCACPEAPATPVDCSSLCAAGAPPDAFYRLSASRGMSTIIAPRMQLGANMVVQVR